MTVEEKAYNYASKVAKNRLTASEIAAHYGRGYIECQEDIRHLAPFVCVSNKTWRPASELPPIQTDIVVWCILDDGQIHVGLTSLSEKKWPDALGKYVKWWCYPPEEEEQ